MGWSRVTAGLSPVLRRLDLGVHIALDLDQVEQVAAGQEFKRLISGELEPCSAEAGVALGEPVADLVERPQSMPTPFSAFLRRRYSPEGSPKPCRNTTAAALGPARARPCGTPTRSARRRLA